ncbi:MAG: SprT-like domain-containing protein [Gammaproteobacteria bacterium]|nr:SprT-like domain-containing protein [Gammaproteobacteria bacterium]
MNPTQKTYSELEEAYDTFNRELFEDSLPHCMITLQRKNRTYGYFSSNRFVHSNGTKTDEIAMNPAYFAVISFQEIMQTLVHEMSHLWQFHFANPGRRSYHNKEWGNKMEQIGLMPSSTGKVGGSKTGDQMMDYVIEGGKFEKTLNGLISKQLTISWFDSHPPTQAIKQLIKDNGINQVKETLSHLNIEVIETDNLEAIFQPLKPTRVKFTCPGCQVNAWGKPSLYLMCGNCDKTLLEN